MADSARWDNSRSAGLPDAGVGTPTRAVRRLEGHRRVVAPSAGAGDSQTEAAADTILGDERAAAEKIYQACKDAGLDALLDDREERPGVKFKDADLIGIPYRVTIGKKLPQGLVEVVERRSKKSDTMAPVTGENDE